jgi:hypothetical protein
MSRWKRPCGPFRMVPKHHPTPLSGGDRKALIKELGKTRAMANILASQSVEVRAKGEALIQQADRLWAVIRSNCVTLGQDPDGALEDD